MFCVSVCSVDGVIGSGEVVGYATAAPANSN